MLNNSKIELSALPNEQGIVPEGPVWSEYSQCLYWPDIVKQQVAKYCPFSNKVMIRQLGFEFSAVALVAPENNCKNNFEQIVLVANNGLYLFDFEADAGQWLYKNAGLGTEHRFNDAKVDKQGRLWLGSLRIGLATDSAGIYTFEQQQIRQLATNFTAANGLGWSPDQTSFYIIDTVPQLLYRYEFDSQSGQISEQQVLIDFNSFSGKPDGMCVDAEGNLWVAMWDGYNVLAFDQHGNYLTKIDVPMPRPTCVTFGGCDLKDLFITTASFGLDESSKRVYPLAGSVLTCRPGVKGMQTHSLQLPKELRL